VQKFKAYLIDFTRIILVRQLIFSFILLELSRIVWFSFNQYWLQPWNFHQLFQGLLLGIYFDMPVVAFFFLPLWLWMLIFPQKAALQPAITRGLFALSAGICILLNGIDTIYSEITTRRTGYELFALLADPGNKIAPYIKAYPFAIAGVLMALVMVYLLAPYKGYSLYLYKGRWWNRGIKYTLALSLFIIGARGGFRLKPLSTVDSGQYADGRFAPLISSTPMQLISTWGQKDITEFKFMNAEEARRLVLQAPSAENPANRKTNVVVLVVESLARDYTGFLNGQPYTPFLDSLSKLSVVFPYCYANGIRSIEMVPSIFCGIPSLMDQQYLNSAYASNHRENAFSYFEKQGYATAFYHGANNGTMRFQSFLKSTGLQNYFGIDEYPNTSIDYDGSWGIYDEPYLQYFGQQLTKSKEPFFFSLFTLSSHHPYRVPDSYKNLPSGPLPIHKTIAYTDQAIRSFFQYAQKQPWFSNTIFIITGDHTSHSKNPYFYSQTGHYEIPLLFYSTLLKPAIINKTVSQCDIIPTLLGYLNQHKPFPGMGRNALDSTYPGYSFHRDNGINFIIQYPYTLGMNDAGKVTDFYSRIRNSTTVTHMQKEGEVYENMLHYLKAYLQVYSHSLIHNTNP